MRLRTIALLEPRDAVSFGGAGWGLLEPTTSAMIACFGSGTSSGEQ